MYRRHGGKTVSIDEKLASLRGLLTELIERKHPYATMMAERGVRPEHIKTSKDMHLLPTTAKSDLRVGYPDGWFARDPHDVVRYHATSGTTGKPTIVSYTRQDLDMWTDSMAWCLDLAGITSKDILQIVFGYGLFTGGLGYHYGAERVGAAVIPTGGGNTSRQVQMIAALRTTVIAGTPSYALRIADAADETGEDISSLRIGLFGAEAWSDDLRRTLERRLGIKAYDLYGLSEAMGPGVGMECDLQDGLHISDDFIPEVLDPDTLEPLPDGEVGELTLTAWHKEAYPAIRYRTRDITKIFSEPCKCGEPTPRFARVTGRTDDMLIMHGVNIFPQQVETALFQVGGLTPNYQIEAWREAGIQKISVSCERAPATSINDVPRLQSEAVKAMKQITGVTIPFTVAEPDSIPRSEGKAVRIIKK